MPLVTLETEAGQRSLFLPQLWDDVTVENFARIYGKTGNDLIAALLDVEVETVKAMPRAVFNFVAAILEFLDGNIPEQINDTIQAINVGVKSVGQLEKCSEILSSFAVWDAAPYVYAIYATEPYSEPEAFKLAEQLKSGSIVSIYAGAVFLINQIAEFYNKYLPLLEKQPDDDEIAAGISRFSKFGFFATLVTKCGGDPLKYDAMLAVPADTFYMTLLLEHEQAEYQSELIKLKNAAYKTE